MKYSDNDIIQCYIRLLSSSPWEDISLSDVAKSLKISKTTVLRHFKTKQALVASAMDFVEGEFSVLGKKLCKTESYRDKLVIATHFLLGNKPAFPFFVQCFVTKHVTLDFPNKHQEKMLSCPVEARYCSLLFFSAVMDALIKGKIESEEDVTDFVNRILLLYQYGLGWQIPTVQVDAPVVSVKEDRFLIALDEVIKTYGPQSLSTARYARCLHIAPSTLYSFFPSRSLMLKEISRVEQQHFFAYLSSVLEGSDQDPVSLVAIAKAIDAYLAVKPAIATFIDGFSWMWSAKAIMEENPVLKQHIVALEAIHQGLGYLSITLPITRKMEETSLVSQADMLRLLFQGCTRKES